MYNNELITALAELIRNESSTEARQYRNLILKRIAEETEVKPSRIPVPLNITELGGYFNLIDQIRFDMPDTRGFGDTSELEKYIKAQRLLLEEQKYQMKLSIIQSALGLPK